MNLGLSQHRVKVVPYDRVWPELFSLEAARISLALGEGILAIEHIGSTSIIGLPSKPIIDLAVGIRDFDEGFELIPLMTELGYTFRGEVGVPRRHFFMLGKPRTHHVHKYEITSHEWRERLAFRDHLRLNSAAMEEYRDLKMKLAEQFPTDISSYSLGKRDFIERIRRSNS